MKRFAPAVVAAILFLQAGSAMADTPDLKAVITAVQQGGYVIVMRHGGTNRDQADTDPLNYDDVTKQRHLSAKGREQAMQVGAAFKKLGIPVGQVYTSRYFRAVETGKLVSGHEVTTTIDVTESGMMATPIETERRTEAMRALANTAPQQGQNTLVVSHKPNIVDAFGKDWFEIKEGEASVFKPQPSGKPALIARVQAVEWIKAAEGR